MNQISQTQNKASEMSGAQAIFWILFLLLILGLALFACVFCPVAGYLVAQGWFGG